MKALPVSAVTPDLDIGEQYLFPGPEAVSPFIPLLLVFTDTILTKLSHLGLICVIGELMALHAMISKISLMREFII